MSSRKQFLQKSGALIAGTTLLSAFNNDVFAIFKNKVAPSDQLNVGLIGVKGMGWSNLVAALKINGVNLVA
jgi:hypothetical protein